MKKVGYDIGKYDFKGRLEKVFDVEDLAGINEQHEVFKRENDQSTHFHKIFYDWARTPEFTSLYEMFIADVVQPIYDDKIVYQHAY